MHEDPTRRMPAPGDEGGGYGQPPGGYPPEAGYGGEPPREPGMSGAMKALLILLAALVIGLTVALVITSGDDGDDRERTRTESTSTTTEPTTTTSTETTTTPTTTTQTTTSTSTTTSTVTQPPEDGGGVEAPE